MTQYTDALHRVVARLKGEALVVRSTSQLSDDPAVTIGIATIRIVTEEQTQAIAYGRFYAPPFLDVRLNPLSRDVTDLELFANFLVKAADDAVALGGPMRVWAPHAKTLEGLDVLGHRYARNPNAPAQIQRMGQICRIIAHEATFPGQQLVAVASEVLGAHLCTGQAPVEDGHLDAFLAWVDPDCTDAVAEARDRTRLPASGVLANSPDRPDDDRVEMLRKALKSAKGKARKDIESKLRLILETAVDREWQMLADARCAFLRLNLPAEGLEPLVAKSNDRVMSALVQGFFPARSADRLASQLETMEVGQQLRDRAALVNDPDVREAARRSGNIVTGTVALIDQPKAGFRPCTMWVDSDQHVVRARIDDKVQVAGTNVSGVVRSVAVSPSGGLRLEIEVSSGFRTRAVLVTGVAVDLLEEAYTNDRGHVFSAVRARQPWVFYADAQPTLPGRVAPPTSPLELAAARRRT